MPLKQTIQYIRHADINRAKWDECLTNADNGFIYGYSVYLDHMARHWDALVLNDYDAVMPLTYNRKYGIHYLYQPFLTSQLGIFGNNLSRELTTSFLQAIPPRFKYWDINLNFNNDFQNNTFKFDIRKNYLLDINKSYDEIRSRYSENIVRNIRKNEQAKCTSVNSFDKKEVIEMAVRQMKTYTNESRENIERFTKLSDFLEQQGQLFTYGIRNSNNELIASSIFLSSHKRYYYILVGNDPQSRDMGASHALIDSFIKDHAGEEKRLDFEGSDIPGLAKFYSSFGAREENYPSVKLNRLPFFLRWLKK